MTGKTRDTGFRHPEAVALLQSLTDEEARTHPPLVREQDGVVTQQRREGGEVRCREVGVDERSGRAASEMEALLSAAESEFGGLLPRLKSELSGGGVPDLDAFEMSIREGLFVCGAKGCAALPEAFEAKLPTPCCRECGEPMERHSRCGKTFQSRFGPLRINRTYCRCRRCGDGCFPLDIALGLEDKTITPRAESLCADVAGSDSYESASRKLWNLAGIVVPTRASEVEGIAGRTSDFAARLDRFGTRNGLFKAKELVVLSDGVVWIRKICEEVFTGRDAAFILDPFHASGMSPPQSGICRRAKADRRRGWTGSRSSWSPGGSLRSSPS